MANNAQEQLRHTPPAKNHYQPKPTIITSTARFVFELSFNSTNSTLVWLIVVGILTNTVVATQQQSCTAVTNPLAPPQQRHPISHAVTSLNAAKKIEDTHNIDRLLDKGLVAS